MFVLFLLFAVVVIKQYSGILKVYSPVVCHSVSALPERFPDFLVACVCGVAVVPGGACG